MTKIVDEFGRPIDVGALKEPQTSRIATLNNQYLTNHLDGLTPARLAAALRNADNGNLVEQHRIFSDMQERDAHMFAEMDKRKNSVIGLDWTIEPPRNATPTEKAHADYLTEVLTDLPDPIEDLILAMTDATGHGFAPIETEWRGAGKEWLPTFHPRPQEWFQLDQQNREIRLRDGSPSGAPLTRFGWVFHTHGKPKTGYAARMGLYRVLSWPFIYKTYGIGDFAEFLEIYGLPMIVGKYFSSATQEEKNSLYRAVVSLGHNARAIMPQEMALEIQKITGGGDATPHMTMVEWAERSESKAILGQTMSAEAKSTGIGSGNADLHSEVRHDILKADAREIAGTLTRDLLFPLLSLNRGGINDLRKCPRFVFDTGEADDIKDMADALPKLVGVGMKIPAQWAHDKLRIPVAADDEDMLAIAAPENALPPMLRPQPGEQTPDDDTAALAALSARAAIEQDALDELADEMASEWEPTISPLLSPVEALMDECATLEEFKARLPEIVGKMDASKLAELLAGGLFAARIEGRSVKKAKK